LTDEAGFAAVNQMHGLSIRIGPAHSSNARVEIASVDRLIEWLTAAAAKIGADGASS
jgi:trehalose-6-phosphatase